jgi:crotonobetainyl-CoA:carnitine CoA-transferase CaiB-like acyl-CoA transferase
MSALKVADFSTHFPGPLTSHLLAELGAEVIKIENEVGGDGNRELPPNGDGRGMYHAMINAGTRSLTASVDSPEWGDIIEAAARWADVVIVGGQLADLTRRGLNFEAFAAANPSIIYCMLPAYGSRGPWAQMSGHGQNMDALAGTLPIEWDADGYPETPSSWRGAGTTTSALFAALGIMQAVHRRTECADAQCIEVSVWGASIWQNWKDFVCQANTGQIWNGALYRGSRYAMYRTSDDRAVLVCPIEQKFWTAFCDILELPEIRDRGAWSRENRMDFGKGAAYEDERARIQSIVGTKPLQHWVDALGAAGIPIAPVFTMGEVIDSEHAVAEELVRTTPGPEDRSGSVRFPRVPIRFVGDPDRDPWRKGVPPAPRLGEHSADLRELLGLSQLRTGE